MEGDRLGVCLLGIFGSQQESEYLETSWASANSWPFVSAKSKNAPMMHKQKPSNVSEI